MWERYLREEAGVDRGERMIIGKVVRLNRMQCACLVSVRVRVNVCEIVRTINLPKVTYQMAVVYFSKCDLGQ